MKIILCLFFFFFFWSRLQRLREILLLQIQDEKVSKKVGELAIFSVILLMLKQIFFSKLISAVLWGISSTIRVDSC